MTTVQANLGALREVPPGKCGEPRGFCESCGLYLWSDGGLKIPSLRGRYCSVLCVEVELAVRSGNRKRVEGVRLGDGQTLLAYLKARAPELWEKATGLTLNPARARLRPQPISERKLAALEKARLAKSRKSKNADFDSLESEAYTERIGGQAISPLPEPEEAVLAAQGEILRV